MSRRNMASRRHFIRQLRNRCHAGLFYSVLWGPLVLGLSGIITRSRNYFTCVVYTPPEWRVPVPPSASTPEQTGTLRWNPECARYHHNLLTQLQYKYDGLWSIRSTTVFLRHIATLGCTPARLMGGGGGLGCRWGTPPQVPPSQTWVGERRYPDGGVPHLGYPTSDLGGGGVPEVWSDLGRGLTPPWAPPIRPGRGGGVPEVGSDLGMGYPTSGTPHQTWAGGGGVTPPCTG